MGHCVAPPFPGLLSTSLALPFHWTCRLLGLCPSLLMLLRIRSIDCFSVVIKLTLLVISSAATALIAIYLLTTPRFITANPIFSLSFRLVNISVCMNQTPRTEQKWVNYAPYQCSGLPQTVITKSCQASLRDSCQSFHFSASHSLHQFRLMAPLIQMTAEIS